MTSVTVWERRSISSILLALFAVIGFDLFLHAGLLSPLYSEPTPFLLDPLTAFRRIPLGYAAFALLVWLTAWLMLQLRISGWRQGAQFGLQMGAAIWIALALGLASISTARPLLLIGWAAGQALELALAGAVIGAALNGMRLRRLGRYVAAIFIVCVILAIVLQNILG